MLDNNDDEENPGPDSRAPSLEMQMRAVMRRKPMSRRTEETYVGWYKRYVRWAGLRHPSEMGAPEVSAFDSHASSGVSRPAGFASLSLSRA